MEKKGVFGRFLVPLLVALGTLAISSLIYHGSSPMTPGTLRTIIKDVSGALMFISIWLFAFIGPPMAYFRGASFAERLTVAFANPLVWLVRMALAVSCQFGAIEMVYFFFLPWTFGVVAVTIFTFSLSELACRAIDRRRDADVRVLHPGVISLLIIGVAGVYFGLIKGQEWAYVIVNHYADHFIR
ncbi:MAG TPA: hypothetical protein PK875_03195 [Spirochaetota bacterium]|nr:MAG: hypothetical protein BWY96_01711 [Spirochaetes bacterium ADurb.BinA120]HPI13384.1 hypothetical protein [Spirochaetota bacterium]HPO44781.1 hypothetical protein [Spirochaetota bacterium]